ncbi:MAG: CvpA family protein [Pseudomonadota bacterium]
MFDLLFLAVVGVSTAFAVLRGGLQELSTLIALGVAAGLAWIAAPGLIGILGLSGSFFGAVIIAVVLLGGFFIAAHIGLHLILKRFPMTRKMRLYNQIGGGVFGFVRGLALVGLGFLGYSYYLDESRQPESVRNAITQPVAAGVAKIFESMAPASTELNGVSAPKPDENAALDGYRRADRSGLDEIVATVTTTDAEPRAADEDDIAELIQGEVE